MKKEKKKKKKKKKAQLDQSVPHFLARTRSISVAGRIYLAAEHIL
jgi:hypothetical protein